MAELAGVNMFLARLRLMARAKMSLSWAKKLNVHVPNHLFNEQLILITSIASLALIRYFS